MLNQNLGVTSQTSRKQFDWRELGRIAFVLFKVRIVSLLLLSAYGGAALGLIASGQNSAMAWFVLTISGGLSAAGASAINQYLERDRDTQMKRTARRPLAVGQIANPDSVLWIGTGMIAIATGVAALWNLSLAFWILFGAVIYVVIYTMWLKPRTTLNIVIGGAAGSCAVISGGAAFGVWSDPAVLLLAAMLFVWTPVHFWALAMAYRDDYATAGYPMLPTQVSMPVAARWTVLHGVLTAASALALGFWPQLDLIYLLPVGLVSLHFLKQSWRLIQQPTGKVAMKLFHASNIYLAVVLVVLLLAPIWR